MLCLFSLLSSSLSSNPKASPVVALGCPDTKSRWEPAQLKTTQQLDLSAQPCHYPRNSFPATQRALPLPSWHPGAKARAFADSADQEPQSASRDSAECGHRAVPLETNPLVSSHSLVSKSAIYTQNRYDYDIFVTVRKIISYFVYGKS